MVSCENCQNVFDGAPDDDGLVAYICEQAPNCCCEACQVSPHCEDPVCNDEVLIRLVVDDTHITRSENGAIELKSTFLQDVVTYGSSTLRLGRATSEEFDFQVSTILGANRMKADGSPREVIGYVRIPVASIRAVMSTVKKDEAAKDLARGVEETVRACAAYATGLAEVPNHADLMLNAYKRHSNSGRNSAMKAIGKAVRDGFIAINSIDDLIALGASK